MAVGGGDGWAGKNRSRRGERRCLGVVTAQGWPRLPFGGGRGLGSRFVFGGEFRAGRKLSLVSVALLVTV